MVSQEKFESFLKEYKSQTNMSSENLQEWRKTKTYREYRKRKSGPPASVALERNLMLQRRIENGTISRDQFDELEKAVFYLRRAKAEYRQEGAGDNKIPGGRTTFRVEALRSWAFDPYSTYT